MAQVVRPQGWIGPLVMTVIGIILLLNGVPALIQWVPWVAQTTLIVGVDAAIETAMVPLLVAGACTFIGFLMMRGGFGALRQRARGAASRATAQARSGVQQVRREVAERSGELGSQAEHLVNKVPQGWRERIEAAAAAVEQERAKQTSAQSQQAQPFRGQGQQQGQPYLGQGQQQGQGHQQGQRGYQQAQQRQPQQAPQQQRQPQPVPQQQRQQQLPGGDRLQRIEQLRQRVDSRTQLASKAEQEASRQAAEQLRRVASIAADRVAHGLPQHLDEATTALVGRLDVADSERIRRRGSSLVRSSLTTSALRKTSLTTNSLFGRR